MSVRDTPQSEYKLRKRFLNKMTAASELHIIVPGICGPLAETSSIADSQFIKRWIKVLSQSDMQQSPLKLYEVFAALFDLSIDGDFPSAALNMLADNNFDSSLNYMFADPVHMEADMNHVILTSSADLAINDDERDILCDVLNKHFVDDGLIFKCLAKDKWVLSSKDNIQLNTTPLLDAVGRNVNFILPKGDNSGYWKKTLTEVQMILHANDINLVRENTGKQSINSLWFHGSGQLPNVNNCKVDCVCSNDNVFKGLASHVQCNYLQLPESAQAYARHLLKNHSESINVLHLSDLEHLVNYSDVSIWMDRLSEVLNHWVYPLLKMANNNNIKVTLYPCNDKKYQFSKYNSYRFWRHGKLEQHVTSY